MPCRFDQEIAVDSGIGAPRKKGGDQRLVPAGMYHTQAIQIEAQR